EGDAISRRGIALGRRELPLHQSRKGEPGNSVPPLPRRLCSADGGDGVRACLKIPWGPAARDFGCGQGGEVRRTGQWSIPAASCDGRANALGSCPSKTARLEEDR